MLVRIHRLARKILSVGVLIVAAICPNVRALDLALVGARLYLSPTEPPFENGTIVIQDGVIRDVGSSSDIKVPPDATTLDCRGRTVTAGFWNSHVHIFTEGLMHSEQLPADKISSQLEQMFTRWGFTTVFDIASVLDNTVAIRKRIATGEIIGPRILTVGEPFYPKGGTPIYVKSFLEQNHVPSNEVEFVRQAVARLRRQIQAGADGVKIFAASFAGGGKIVPLPVKIATAIVNEAHRAGKPVFAHPSNMEGIEIAVQSRVDILAHTAPLSGPWPSTLIDRMKSNHMALIPTLTLFKLEGKRTGESANDIEAELNTACGQLKSYQDAGGQILFGTDVGYTNYFDTAEEYQLMSRAGLTFQQILSSLTTNPAERFGESRRRGRIAKGMVADLVVLDNDPAREITALSKVHNVIIAGKLVYTLH